MEALFHDAPVGIAVPASDLVLNLNSSGSRIFGRALLPALTDRTQRTPVVLFLHGFPGNEKNLDIAQLLRMTAVACVTFSYRGVWGSKGDYCFSHLAEDTLAVAAQLREQAEQLRIDPDRLYLFGHSMGGFAAVQALSSGLAAKGAFLMAPCDIAYRYLYERERFTDLLSAKHQGYFTLPTENYIEDDVAAHAEAWYFPAAAQRMPISVPYYTIGGTRDTVTPPETNLFPLTEALRARGAQVDYLELDETHSFPGSRFRVAEYVAQGIRKAEAKGDRNGWTK